MPGKERGQQHLHAGGASAGRTWFHHACCGVYRRNKDRIKGQQVHICMAQDRGKEPGEAAGEFWEKQQKSVA